MCARQTIGSYAGYLTHTGDSSAALQLAAAPAKGDAADPLKLSGDFMRVLRAAIRVRAREGAPHADDRAPRSAELDDAGVVDGYVAPQRIDLLAVSRACMVAEIAWTVDARAPLLQARDVLQRAYAAGARLSLGWPCCIPLALARCDEQLGAHDDARFFRRVAGELITTNSLHLFDRSHAGD